MADHRFAALDRRRRPPAWLLDHRGRRYRSPSVAGAVEFEVMYQEAEGRLWRRVMNGAGAPVRLPLQVTQGEFLLAVRDVPGAYQLVPINGAGLQRGDPPQLIMVRPAGDAATVTATLAAAPTPEIVASASGAAASTDADEP